MGHLVSGHFTVEKPDPERVRAALPAPIAFRIYKHDALAVFAVDTFRASKPPRQPLSAATPATDLPLALPSTGGRERAVRDVRAKGTANGLKRSYIHLSCALSAKLIQPVLSLFSDDDGNDFACVSRNGAAERIAARCGNELILFDRGRLCVTRDDGVESRLHAVASREFELFTGKPASALVLGTFSPPHRFGLVEE